jgi:tyrosyl-tRNA synthetase
MSKSLGNYIGIAEPPQEIYGKTMSISDALMVRYWELLTDKPLEEIAEMRRGIESGELHPMALKQDLARRLVEDFHGPEEAARAAEHFERVHQRRETPEQVTEVKLDPAHDMNCVTALVQTGLAPSKSEARRLIKAGAVSANGEKITDPSAPLPAKPFLLRCGKVRFVKVV